MIPRVGLGEVQGTPGGPTPYRHRGIVQIRPYMPQRVPVLIPHLLLLRRMDTELGPALGMGVQADVLANEECAKRFGVFPHGSRVY